MDLVFSLDSIFTAIALTDQIAVMVAAIIISVGVMLFAVKPIGDFVDRHTNIKVVALLFLILLGVLLVGEGLDYTVPKIYLYLAVFGGLVMEGIRKALYRT